MMKNKIIYYIALVALFIVCMMSMVFLMTGIEMWLDIKLGRLLTNLGFLVGIGLFIAIKPFIKRCFEKKKGKLTP